MEITYKKTLCGTVAALMLIGMASCGSDKPTETTGPEQTTATTVATTPKKPGTTAKKPGKTGTKKPTAKPGKENNAKPDSKPETAGSDKEDKTSGSSSSSSSSGSASSSSSSTSTSSSTRPVPTVPAAPTAPAALAVPTAPAAPVALAAPNQLRHRHLLLRPSLQIPLLPSPRNRRLPSTSIPGCMSIQTKLATGMKSLFARNAAGPAPNPRQRLKE